MCAVIALRQARGVVSLQTWKELDMSVIQSETNPTPPRASSFIPTKTKPTVIMLFGSPRERARPCLFKTQPVVQPRYFFHFAVLTVLADTNKLSASQQIHLLRGQIYWDKLLPTSPRSVPG